MEGAIWFVIIFAIYFLPSFVGMHKKNAGAILVLNLFLGWTMIGWIIALVWATTKD
jgi:threonine/homoserine/homoserine lactone efflux protein